MLPVWILRLLLSLGLILAGWGLYHLARRLSLRNAAGRAGQLGTTAAGTATIVYFTTPDCVACKVAQRPALNRLQEKLGERLKVIEVDAYENPGMAREWGVLSVPTTFILDPAGSPRQVNYGVTGAEKLFEQVKPLFTQFS